MRLLLYSLFVEMDANCFSPMRRRKRKENEWTSSIICLDENLDKQIIHLLKKEKQVKHVGSNFRVHYTSSIIVELINNTLILLV